MRPTIESAWREEIRARIAAMDSEEVETIAWSDLKRELLARRLLRSYEVVISWSQDDDAFVAEVPELPGCAAHGDTADSAFVNCQDAVDLWIRTAKEFGRAVPEPKGRRPQVL